MTIAVEVDDLTVRYGRIIAVNGLSLTAGFGAVTAVLGPNGAGKTSTIECCEGYRRPSSGQVRVDGLDPVSYTHLRAHETVLDLVCRLLLEKKKTNTKQKNSTH